MCRHSITADHPTVIGLPAFCSAVVVASFGAEDALHPLGYLSLQPVDVVKALPPKRCEAALTAFTGCGTTLYAT